MRSLILPILLVIGSFTSQAQGNMFHQKVLAKIQNYGTIKRTVSESQLNIYLTSALNKMGIEGFINQSSILYLQKESYWVIQGTGFVNNVKDKVRNIRVQLEDAGGNKLKIMVGGTTESCLGDPCEKCDFASGGGCNCVRTSSSQIGLSGICNHSITKTTIGNVASNKNIIKGKTIL